MKDDHPLPSLDEALQIINGAQMVSFLDGYSDYNQIMVSHEDRLKMAFTTKWGTFAYRCIPFGLINVGATFQKLMDTTFEGLVNKCIIIYMDYLTIFSWDKNDHPTHLAKICERCHWFDISLNPTKCIIGVTEGKLLGLQEGYYHLFQESRGYVEFENA